MARPVQLAGGADEDGTADGPPRVDPAADAARSGPRPVPVPSGRIPRHVDDELDALARRARAGDAAALRELLAGITPYVLAYCRSRLGAGRVGLAGPEDVAQEALLGVCKSLPTFEQQRSPFMAFVYGISAKKVADAFRAARRDRSTPIDEPPERVDDRQGPEALAIRGEDAHLVSQLLDRLPARQREIVVLRIGLGLSAEETGRTVGTTPGAVRVAQHRAFGKLRRWIAEEGL